MRLYCKHKYYKLQSTKQKPFMLTIDYHLQYLFIEEIHFCPSYSLFQVIQFSNEILPVGGPWEQLSPVVIKSRSFLSISTSQKYQFMGQVSHNARFLLIPVTTLHLVLNTFAQCSIISLNVTLSGPTASISQFYLLYIPLTIRSAISSTCTYWKQQLPSPGMGKKGNFLTKQAVLLISIPYYTFRPKIAQGFTIHQSNPDSFRCFSTLAFYWMQGKGESSDV